MRTKEKMLTPTWKNDAISIIKPPKIAHFNAELKSLLAVQIMIKIKTISGTRFDGKTFGKKEAWRMTKKNMTAPMIKFCIYGKNTKKIGLNYFLMTKTTSNF